LQTRSLSWPTEFYYTSRAFEFATRLLYSFGFQSD
jgi:hypothetical protein